MNIHTDYRAIILKIESSWLEKMCLLVQRKKFDMKELIKYELGTIT